MKKLRVLDLFSGIGGFSLGLERTGGFETVAFCEIEEFPRKVLAKHWPEVPQYEDVRTLRGEQVGPVDIICGGYPCQPFSTAGKRRGEEDDRHLWPEFSRLVDELRPAWVIGENVAGHISMGLDDVLSDLEGKGYACRPFVIPACAKGAHHRRDRTWVIAHSSDILQSRKLDNGRNQSAATGSQGCNELQERPANGKRVWSEPGTSASMVAHAESQRRAEARQLGGRRSKRTTGASAAPEDVSNPQRIGCIKVVTPEQSGAPRKGPTGEAGYRSGPGWWAGWLPEPDVGRVADGVPHRVDRLKSLGNAVVPQIPEMIGHAILQAEATA